MQNEMSFEELQEIVSICMDEIMKLKRENQILRDKQSELTQEILGLADNEKKIIKNMCQYSTMSTNIRVLESAIENLKYEWNAPNADTSRLFFPKFYDIEDTIEMIIRDKKSMARFGDGEFAIMCNKQRQQFQHLDEKLAARLREVIASDEEGILIGIANNYGDLSVYNKHGKAGIRDYMTEEVREEHRQFLDMDRIYHNAYISRPYALYADNNTDAPKKRFMNLKRIWDNRNVIFVEGALTRLGVGNDLFDNAASIRRIEVPPESSFDKYDEILEASLKYAEQDTLFLIAMGPSAGVLAYDLYKAGYQALDIGHVDLEYEWYLKGEGKHCEVRHKYNNEYYGGDLVEDIQDEEYLGQILCVIEPPSVS